MVVQIFSWNPFRFHCYGIPAEAGGSPVDLVYVADLFPAWMVPGLVLHEWVELRTGSHRLGVLAEILAYNAVWPLYHLNYLWVVLRFPLSGKLFT